MLRKHYLAVSAFGLFLLTGCGGGLPSVTGVVTMDGQPLEGAVVMFTPAGTAGQVATGVTDSSGKFSMGTDKQENGVRPGKYRVTITKTAEVPKPVPYFGDVMAQKYAAKAGGDTKEVNQEVKQDVKQMQAEGMAARKKRRPTPPMYQDPAKTPLVAYVPAQRDYHFDLKSDGK